jgi:hypothetical protein
MSVVDSLVALRQANAALEDKLAEANELRATLAQAAVRVTPAVAAVAAKAMMEIDAAAAIVQARLRRGGADREGGSEVAAAFDAITGGAAQITAAEIQYICSNHGDVLSDEEAFELVKQVDANGDGEIERAEFIAWFVATEPLGA